MAISLCSIFVVIATAAAVNKIKQLNLSWFTDEYMAAYLAEEHIPVGIPIPNPALVATIWALGGWLGRRVRGEGVGQHH